MNKNIDERLVQMFKSPLSYLDRNEVSKYRKLAIRNSLYFIGAGLALYVFLFVIYGGDYLGNSGIRDPRLLLLLVSMSSFVYGVLSLLTIRNRVTDLARKDLVSNHQELRVLETTRLQELEQAKSKSRIGVAILFISLTVLGLGYLYFNYVATLQ